MAHVLWQDFPALINQTIGLVQLHKGCCGRDKHQPQFLNHGCRENTTINLRSEYSTLFYTSRLQPVGAIPAACTSFRACFFWFSQEAEVRCPKARSLITPPSGIMDSCASIGRFGRVHEDGGSKNSTRKMNVGTGKNEL